MNRQRPPSPDPLEPGDLRRIAHLEQGGVYFHYRVAGVAVDAEHVLLHRTELDDFWSLPGGHVNVGEMAEDALRREMLEEMGVPVAVGRLLWVVENFFHHGGAPHHELGLYFLIDLGAGSPLYDTVAFAGQEGALRVEFQWFPRRPDVLLPLPVLPLWLAEGLVTLPETPRHIVDHS
jgi:ADP-ribose pyrophosphatase YjhB (NUDIX family)